MRLPSRSSVVGNFFVLAFVLLVSACQSTPAPSGSTVPSVATAAPTVAATVEATAEPVVEPTATVVEEEVDATEGLTETVGVTQTVELTEAVGITESVEVTEAVEVSVTPAITASEVLTVTMEVTSTEVVTPVTITSSEAVSETVSETVGDAALVEAGLAVYRAQYCGVCHSLDAAETRGTFGPTHNGLAATVDGYLADGIYTGKATTPAEYVLESIVEPQAFIVPGFATTSHRMPSYAHLDQASLDALVAFLLAH